MNKLDNKKREQVIAALVEGNSIRATVRMTGVAKNTIVKLLADIGEACLEYQDKSFRNLICKRIHLTMRMSMRRFTRLTNAFSKKIENHIHAISLHYMYYNFVRVHKTLHCAPAMEAGVTKRLWEISDIVALLD